MSPRPLLLAPLILALTAGCAGKRGGFYGAGDVTAAATPPAGPTSPRIMTPLPRDVHSFARPEIARVHHVDLDLRADFVTRKLVGTADLNILAAPGATAVVLDTRDLTIRAVTDGDGAPLRFELGEAAGVRGRPLTVHLSDASAPRGVRSRSQPSIRGGRIVVHYETAPDAAALQWLTPEQTAGKRRPYLFTQGQAILTRS